VPAFFRVATESSVIVRAITKERAMAKDAFHDRLLAIVTKLPGAYEDRPWGSVHCKVDGKIFVGWGRMDDGRMSLGVRVPIDEQPALVEHDPRFTVAKYVGRYGGVDMRMDTSPDWREVEKYIVGSYRMIASKKRIKELDAMLGGGPVAKTVARKKPTGGKPRRKR
jgi:predicted DNA-binding protein (MmcQ/YjbR family)